LILRMAIGVSVVLQSGGTAMNRRAFRLARSCLGERWDAQGR
jgi:hypothetical protein